MNAKIPNAENVRDFDNQKAECVKKQATGLSGLRIKWIVEFLHTYPFLLRAAGDSIAPVLY